MQPKCLLAYLTINKKYISQSTVAIDVTVNAMAKHVMIEIQWYKFKMIHAQSGDQEGMLLRVLYLAPYIHYKLLCHVEQFCSSV